MCAMQFCVVLKAVIWGWLQGVAPRPRPASQQGVRPRRCSGTPRGALPLEFVGGASPRTPHLMWQVHYMLATSSPRQCLALVFLDIT